MKVSLVFNSWYKFPSGRLTSDEESELNDWVFHAGSTWEGEIKFDDPSEEAELRGRIKEGYHPLFRINLSGNEEDGR